ncbi:MAG: hypothetical protein NXH85_17430 [Pseudomonadaceae bacterium]|nr:hypothetical protein [Pseudomonadaceae bacterium]
MSSRLLLWVLGLCVYALFLWWYSNTDGRLTDAEIDAYMATMDAAEPERAARLREFMAADDGQAFIMINIMDSADEPISPATGEVVASGDELMGHYMQHMLPAMLMRASHPVFFGSAVAGPMDYQGMADIDGWSDGALVRYRSRRDIMDIIVMPETQARHVWKLASVDRTLAFPLRPSLNPGDPRILLALLLVIVLLLIDLRRSGQSSYRR